MNPRLRLAAWLVTLLGAGGLLTGCVERRFVITTEPTGAIVYDEKGLRMGGDGKAPVDRTFIYYGDYQFTLVADSYETQVVREKVRAPFYEWFLLDFFSENVIPWTIRDIRRFNYQLQPRQVVPPDTVLGKATDLRQRGLAIGVPLSNQPPGAGPVTSALMPAVP
ncbi:MAG TPA: hypothetical protein VNX28_06190 [Gemmataceae bacterium]|jgi:hypothetical protein|nr:hypothetical protein [Gemmataceae bacterium]